MTKIYLEDELAGLVVFDDFDHGGHVITWNGGATFNVWSVLGNSFSFQALRNVNVFTRYDVENDLEASIVAREWWESCGLTDTLTLEREGL